MEQVILKRQGFCGDENTLDEVAEKSNRAQAVAIYPLLLHRGGL